MTGPAFILGNGPTLPVGALGLLRGQFTIGVNRILRSGFVPTVILWIDSSVYQDDGDEIDASGAVLVCDSSVARNPLHHGLETWVGDAAIRRASTPTTLVCCGNSGCCAARWALALKCRPVYLLGMDAEYSGEKTSFYGSNPWHVEGTLRQMKQELDRLRRDFPREVRVVTHAEALARIVAGLPTVRTQELRRHLRALLRKVTHGT